MNVHVPAFSPPSRDALAWLGTRPIPTKPFYDPVWYADEVETIFKRTWIQLGHVCELPRPDSFIVRNLEFAGLIFVLAGRHKRASIRERIEAAGASLRPLPPGSPDFNPIEKAFARLKAILRKVAERTVTGLWDHIGQLLDIFQPDECANCFSSCACYPT